MKISCSTLGSPLWTLQQMADYADVFGLDGIEIRGFDQQISVNFTPEQRAETKKLFDDKQIEIPCLTAYTRFDGATQEDRDANIVQLKKMIHLAADIGAASVRTYGGELQGTIDGFLAVADIAEARNVKVLLETHDSLCMGEQVIKIFEKVHSPAFGVIWDVMNTMYFTDEKMEDTWNILKDRIHHIHIKDWINLIGDDPAYRLVLLGSGALPIEKLLNMLQADGYQKYLSFEWEKAWHAELEEPEIAFLQYGFKMRQLLERLG